MYKSMNNYQRKVSILLRQFESCEGNEAIYDKIIEIGKNFDKNISVERAIFNETHKVLGCQSSTYLKSEFKEGVLWFTFFSDALISKGLVAILVSVYNQELPEIILKNSPDFLKELGIVGSLTMSRANGLASAHLKMRQEALKYLINV